MYAVNMNNSHWFNKEVDWLIAEQDRDRWETETKKCGVGGVTSRSWESRRQMCYASKDATMWQNVNKDCVLI